MKIERPAPGEYNPVFERYLARVPEDDALPVLARQPAQVRTALESISGERAGFRYGPDKWSIREVVGHFTDAERVFGFRALTFARGDKTALPGFEENDYAASAGHDRYALPDLVAEFEALRRSHVSMLAHLDSAAVARVGTANGSPVSVRAIAFIMAGHVRHHLGVLASKYGVEGAV
jgi:hypothetical protein